MWKKYLCPDVWHNYAVIFLDLNLTVKHQWHIMISLSKGGGVCARDCVIMRKVSHCRTASKHGTAMQSSQHNTDVR